MQAATLPRALPGLRNSISTAITVARAHLTAGMEQEALVQACAILKTDTHNFDAHVILAELALRKVGGGELAAKLSRTALSIKPGSPAAELLLLEAFAAQKRWGEVEPMVLRYLRRLPQEARAHLVFARMREGQGRSKEAGAALRRALSFVPLNSKVALDVGYDLKRAGLVLESQGSFQKAVGVGEPVVPVDPLARRVRVAFLLQVAQTWTSLKSVWQAFAADDACEVTLIAAPIHSEDPNATGANAIFDLLKKEAVPFVRADEFSFTPNFADVLFVQSPYDYARTANLHVPQLLKMVPRLAYVPYALEIGGGDENVTILTNLPLHRFAWMIFARSDWHRKVYGRYCQSGNAHVTVTGHPKLDMLSRLDAERDPALEAFVAGRKMVVWNPHFNLRDDGTEWGNGYSTFLRWHRFLPTEFARRQDIAFVIRPHPLFFDTLRQRKLMSQEEVADFVARCEAAGNIHIDRRSSYLPVFASASAMMSDASSFILEFAATGKPLLYLHNPRGPGLNADGEFVRDYCEIAQTEATIVKFLDAVFAGDDPRRKVRLAALRREFLHIPDEGAGVAIKNAVFDRLKHEVNVSIDTVVGVA